MMYKVLVCSFLCQKVPGYVQNESTTKCGAAQLMLLHPLKIRDSQVLGALQKRRVLGASKRV
ncbi:MAG: hypothetical protein ACJAUP_001873 [Cellvibrionaceae bacterium]|jgi:hypothetical protein